MADVAGTDRAHHPTGASRLAAAFARPRAIAIACIVALTGLGWVYLALMVAGTLTNGSADTLGPGMGMLDLIVGRGQFGGLGGTVIAVLCRPSIDGSAIDQLLVLPMWCAMTLAMMLPTAGPMIVTYTDIAETAAAKGERIVPPWVLIAGFVTVWLGFALVATLGQGLLARAALIDAGMASQSVLFSGATFLAAGVYQFSPLKQACLTQCQRPFPFFFANWTTETAGVFKLGLRQGLYCLGCCWAMMLVMFAVGVMNIVWMAALGIVMTIEKLATGARFTRVVGAALALIGAVLIAVTVVDHWPVSAPTT